MKQTSSMHNKYTKLLFGFLLSILLAMYADSVQAQTYPVQTNVYLMPPYGKHLNDYYTTSKEKLVVSLLNRDQLKPVLEVRLRMTITASNGLKLQSKEEVNYPTITLDANIPTRLTQDDLAPYFQYVNSQGYLDQGKLPDGMVEFTFQVIEKYTGKVLSAPATGRVWLSTQKPPILRLPSRNDAIGYRDPMNLKFQWEPQHKNLSQVEYEFELREIPDNGAAPQSAFMYSPIIHQQRQLYTYLIYDVMMPPLDPNKLYGWRVRAIAKDGVDELNLFDNNGYSEIYWFRTQDNCQPPTALSVDLQNRRFDLKWLPEIGNNEFVVQYRPKYGTSEQWQEVRTYDLNTSIYDMQRGTVYEYRVGAICTSGQPVFTNTGEVSIPSVDSTRLANCGVLPILDLENKERLPELRVGDRVELSDYPMTVTKVSGSNGSFTGEGWVPVNWLLETKWAVEFSNITVNTDYKMIAGSVRAKYDETEGNIANIDQITEGGSDNTRNGIIIPDIELNFVIPENPNFSYNEETEKLVVFDTAGNPQSVDGPKGNDGKVVFPITIKDKDGNLHKVDVSRDKDGNPIVDEDGNPAKDSNGNVILESSYLGNQNSPFEEGSFNKKNIATDIAVVTFEKGDGIYAFDEWLDVYASISKIADKYDHLAAQGLNKSKYDVSWKLLPVGTSDVVEATIKISKDFDKSKETKAFDPKEVIFATEEGLRFAAEFDGKNKYTINLSSVAAKDIQEIYVLYPENGSSESFYTLGKLNVISYDKQERKVVLVQVNGNKADQTEVQNYLDKVYNPVGVSLQVVAVEDFSYSGDLTDMLKDESGLFDSYNDKMQKLQDAYKASNDLTKDANYLFILGKSGSYEAGFNPRGKQFGYIFTDSKQKVAHTIAHELGHGCWKLTHTFDSTYGSKIDKKDLINLMSYGGGVHLARWQWDVMDAPAWFTNPLDGDDKGMAISQGEGILVKGKAYYAMHGSFVIELTGITVLPICGYPNVNTLLAFKDTNGEVWITNVYGGLINQETTGYVNIKNRNQKYPQKVKSLEPGDTVMRINYNSEKSELSIDKVFFKTLASVSVNFDVFSYINYNGTTFESSVYAKAIVDDPCKDNSSAAPYLVEANLKALEKTLRPDQSVELEYWNNDLNKTQIFTIKDGKVSEVSKPSSLDDILDGKWDDASDTKVRYTINNKGIVQVSAIGFKDGLQFDKSKKLDNRELSEHVTAQTNKYLSDNGVKSFSQKPDKVEQSDTFADGGNIAIGGGNASFVKIISDGVDVTSHLLKTGEFEERTYLTSSAATEAIHAPGIVTGVVEVGAQKITDLTSIGVLAYDLVVDEKVRKEMSDQLGEIKTQIQDDYKTFVPIMGEVLLTVTSGNTTEDMKAIFDEKTDTGKRAHLAVRGTGNTIITVMAGTAFVKNLPEISKKLSDNIANIQKLRANVRKVITTDAGKEYLKKFFNEKVKVGDFQEWYKDMITTNYSRVINFEVHHIFPVDLLKNNRFVKLCDEFGFDIDKFNGIENAIPLPKKTTKYNTTGHASHKKYNDFVEEKINGIVNKDGWSDKRKFEAIMDFSDDLKNKLEKNVLLGDKNVNDIRDWF